MGERVDGGRLSESKEGSRAKRADIQALLGHESINTTQIYTNVGQERMEQVLERLRTRASAGAEKGRPEPNSNWVCIRRVPLAPEILCNSKADTMKVPTFITRSDVPAT